MKKQPNFFPTEVKEGFTTAIRCIKQYKNVKCKNEFRKFKTCLKNSRGLQRPPPLTKNKKRLELQVLRINPDTKKDLMEQSKALTKRLVEKGYNENEIQQQISKIFTIERAHLPQQKNQAASNRIPLILTYNRTFQDIKRAVNKHLDLLKINRDFEGFYRTPYNSLQTKQKNLQDILDKKTFVNNKKQLPQNIDQNGCPSPATPS